MAAVLNGGARSWFLGIIAAFLLSLIAGVIVFQRQTHESFAHTEERLKQLEGRAREAIFREFARLDQRLDKIEEALDRVNNTRMTTQELQREFHIRDLAIQRIEKRLDELERRR